METTVRQFIIGMLLVVTVFAGCFYLIGSALPSNSATLNDTVGLIDKFNDTKAHADATANTERYNTPKDTGTLGIINGLAEVGSSALQSIWDSFDIMKTILDNLSGAVGLDIPYWFTGMIITIIMITIAFSLMAAWFKWWL